MSESSVSFSPGKSWNPALMFWCCCFKSDSHWFLGLLCSALHFFLWFFFFLRLQVETCKFNISVRTLCLSGVRGWRHERWQVVCYLDCYGVKNVFQKALKRIKERIHKDLLTLSTADVETWVDFCVETCIWFQPDSFNTPPTSLFPDEDITHVNWNLSSRCCFSFCLPAPDTIKRVNAGRLLCTTAWHLKIPAPNTAKSRKGNGCVFSCTKSVCPLWTLARCAFGSVSENDHCRLLFFTSCSSHGDPEVWPKRTMRLQWEVERGISYLPPLFPHFLDLKCGKPWPFSQDNLEVHIV